jgi:hypothetical protein
MMEKKDASFCRVYSLLLGDFLSLLVTEAVPIETFSKSSIFPKLQV